MTWPIRWQPVANKAPTHWFLLQMPPSSSTTNIIPNFPCHSRSYHCTSDCHWLGPRTRTKGAKWSLFASHWLTRVGHYWTRAILIAIILRTAERISLLHGFKQWFAASPHHCFSSLCVSKGLLVNLSVTGSTLKWQTFFFILSLILDIYRPSALFPPLVRFDNYSLRTNGFWGLSPF